MSEMGFGVQGGSSRGALSDVHQNGARRVRSVINRSLAPRRRSRLGPRPPTPPVVRDTRHPACFLDTCAIVRRRRCSRNIAHSSGVRDGIIVIWSGRTHPVAPIPEEIGAPVGLGRKATSATDDATPIPTTLRTTIQPHTRMCRRVQHLHQRFAHDLMQGTCPHAALMIFVGQQRTPSFAGSNRWLKGSLHRTESRLSRTRTSHRSAKRLRRLPQITKFGELSSASPKTRSTQPAWTRTVSTRRRCRSGPRYIGNVRRAQCLSIAPPTDRDNGNAPGGIADLLRSVVETQRHNIVIAQSQTAGCEPTNIVNGSDMALCPQRAVQGGRTSQFDNG